MGYKRNKNGYKNSMQSNTFWRYVLIPCTIVLIGTVIYMVWYMNMQKSTYKNIEYIKGFMTSSGKLNDFSNKIGMHDPKTDIKWYKTDDEIRIEFGRIFLTWEPKDFYNEENLTQLSTIGITTEIKTDKEGKKTLHLFYMGEEIERWVK